MSTGSVHLNQGRKIAMHKYMDSATTYTVPNSFKVGTGGNTPTILDTDLQTPILIAGADIKAIAAGYPTFDDGNLVATTRCLVLTTECNGNNLREFGLANQDATPLVTTRLVHTAIAKTINVQVIYVTKDKFE